MKLSLKHRLHDVAQQVGKVPEVARDMARRAMGPTLKAGREAVYAAMRRGFDRPTPYALNALRVEEPGAAGPLRGAVMVKGRQDVPGSAIPPQSFLRAEILGGARRWKRLEVALLRAGMLPRGWYAVPGAGARLDQYGNMSRGQVVQVMAFLQLFSVARGERRAGYRSNSSAASRARVERGTRYRFGVELFVSSPTQAYRRGGLAPGVWTRQVNATNSRGKSVTKAAGALAPLRPVLLFVRSAKYRQRLDFFGELQRSTSAAFSVELDRAGLAARRAYRLKDAR